VEVAQKGKCGWRTAKTAVRQPPETQKRGLLSLFGNDYAFYPIDADYVLRRLYGGSLLPGFPQRVSKHVERAGTVRGIIVGGESIDSEHIHRASPPFLLMI